MLDPRLFSNRQLSAGSLSIFIQFSAFFGFTFVALQYLQGVRGYSPLIAALSVLPLSAAMMPAVRTTPRGARFGARYVCVAGLVLVAAGLAVVSRIGISSPYWLLLAGLVPLGTGMGAAMTPATSAITEALPAALSKGWDPRSTTCPVRSAARWVSRSSAASWPRSTAPTSTSGVPAPLAHRPAVLRPRHPLRRADQAAPAPRSPTASTPGSCTPQAPQSSPRSPSPSCSPATRRSAGPPAKPSSRSWSASQSKRRVQGPGPFRKLLTERTGVRARGKPRARTPGQARRGGNR